MGSRGRWKHKSHDGTDTVTPARRVALDVLLAIASAERTLTAKDALQRRWASPPPVSPRDRAFATGLVYGTLRHRLTLDRVVEVFADRTLDFLDAPLREVLRLGLFQLLFLDHVPSYAAVDQATQQASIRSGKGAAGFANAVLRRVAEEAVRSPAPEAPTHSLPRPEGGWAVLKRPVLPDPSESPEAHLALAYSHPEWVVRRWLGRFGMEATRRILEADNAPPPLTLRVNPLKTTREALLERLALEGVAAGPGRHPAAVRLTAPRDLTALVSFREGLFTVQDETEIRVAEAAGPGGGETLLDLCAAPGGKSIHLAELNGDKGRVVCVDRSPLRMPRIGQTAVRCGLRSIRAVCADGRRLPLRGGCFDRVLLDVPCSNSGVMGKRPEVRWRLSTEKAGELAPLQAALLDSAAAQVRSGGMLVYSTCSLFEEENESVTGGFLRRRPEFAWKRDETTLPEPGVCGGGYLAVFQKK